MMYFQSINGKQIDQISINDRGLAYGDGLFTTAKILNGKLELLDQHINRLKTGCGLLNINEINFNELESNLIRVSKDYDIAVLKVVITSGEGGRGYSRVGIGKPNIIIRVSEFPNKYIQWQKKGITLGDATIQLGLNSILSGLKHLNRLEQVLLRAELDKTSYDDLLVVNITNHIVETTCANLFWFENGQLFTPEIKNSGISGILRSEILRKHPNTKIVQANQSNILKAESIFITNSIMNIVPVKCYAGNELDIKQIHQFKEQIAKIY